MTTSSPSVDTLLSLGRLQEAEWLIRRGDSDSISLSDLARRLGTTMPAETFYVSPGYYAPLASWSDAERLCGLAYQAETVVERYRRSTKETIKRTDSSTPIGPYVMRQLAALQHVWNALEQPKTLRVLDFGGALGNHFHALMPHWPWCSLEWTVCETAAVAAAGATEFRYQSSDGNRVDFTANASEILSTGIDLVFASGSLQYLENWQDMLQQFSRASWLLIDRVPLISHPSDLIAIQVVPASYTDTRYPGWKFAESTWLPRLNKAGFELEMRWILPEDRWSVLDLESGSYRWSAKHDHGFLLRSKTIRKSPMIF